MLGLQKTIVAVSLILSVGAAHANVLGDMQTFAPNTDGRDFITVHTGRPLDKGWWAFSNYVNYAQEHLLVYSDLQKQTAIRPYRDQLLEYDLDIAYGVNERLQLFFASPILIWQQPDKDQALSVNVTRGPATYRPGFKWTLTDDSRSNSAVLFSADILSVRNSPYTGLDPAPIYNFEWAHSWLRREGRMWGLNLGYRLRQPGAIPADARMLPLDDQWMASLGYSAPFTKTSRWVFEVFASTPAQRGVYNKTEEASSLDILLGLKHRWFKNINFDWGFTFEPPGVETLAPRLRGFAGVVYYWTGQERPPSTPTAVASETIAESSVDPLKVTPETAEVFDGSSLRLSGEGGQPPYRFEIVQGDATINETTGVVRTRTPGQVRARLSDSRPGYYVDATINVKPVPKADFEIVLNNLEFVFGTDQLTKVSLQVFNRQVPGLRKINIQKLIIEGHTDSVGEDLYNIELSERRGETVKSLLLQELGLTESQVTVIGRGESRPVATNDTDAGRQKNRRVQLKIYGRKK